MKKTLFISLMFVLAVSGHLYADGTTDQSASGTAIVNDLNMYGKNISNVKEVDSETVVTKGFHDKDDPSFGVDPNNTSIMNRIRTPYSATVPNDVVRKDKIDSLLSLSDTTTGVGILGNPPSNPDPPPPPVTFSRPKYDRKDRFGYTNSSGEAVRWKCKSGFEMIRINDSGTITRIKKIRDGTTWGNLTNIHKYEIKRKFFRRSMPSSGGYTCVKTPDFSLISQADLITAPKVYVVGQSCSGDCKFLNGRQLYHPNFEYAARTGETVGGTSNVSHGTQTTKWSCKWGGSYGRLKVRCSYVNSYRQGPGGGPR